MSTSNVHPIPPGGWAPATRLRLRRFLYLDESITNEYLAQVEGGLYVEEAQSESTVREGGAGLRGRAGPIGAELSRSRALEETTSRTVRQTPEALFDRLAGHLENEEAVQYLDGFDDSIWEQLRRGEVIEVESRLEAPAVIRLLTAAEGFEALRQFMDAAGDPMDAETREGLEMMGAFAGMLSEYPVFARPLGTPGFCFVSPLRSEALRVPLGDLEGEATLYATIERKLGPRETWSLLDVIGLGGLPRAARRDAERELKAMKEFGGNVIRPPAAIVAPIAIFR